MATSDDLYADEILGKYFRPVPRTAGPTVSQSEDAFADSVLSRARTGAAPRPTISVIPPAPRITTTERLPLGVRTGETEMEAKPEMVPAGRRLPTPEIGEATAELLGPRLPAGVAGVTAGLAEFFLDPINIPLALVSPFVTPPVAVALKRVTVAAIKKFPALASKIPTLAKGAIGEILRRDPEFITKIRRATPEQMATAMREKVLQLTPQEITQAFERQISSALPAEGKVVRETVKEVADFPPLSAAEEEQIEKIVQGFAEEEKAAGKSLLPESPTGGPVKEYSAHEIAQAEKFIKSVHKSARDQLSAEFQGSLRQQLKASAGKSGIFPTKELIDELSVYPANTQNFVKSLLRKSSNQDFEKVIQEASAGFGELGEAAISGPAGRRPLSDMSTFLQELDKEIQSGISGRPHIEDVVRYARKNVPGYREAEQAVESRMMAAEVVPGKSRVPLAERMEISRHTLQMTRGAPALPVTAEGTVKAIDFKKASELIEKIGVESGKPLPPELGSFIPQRQAHRIRLILDQVKKGEIKLKDMTLVDYIQSGPFSPSVIFERVGLGVVNETMVEREIAFHGEVSKTLQEVGALWHKYSIKRFSPEDRAAAVLVQKVADEDKEAMDAIIKKAVEEGVDIEKLRPLVGEFRTIMDRLAFTFKIPSEDYIDGYLSHIWAGRKFDETPMDVMPIREILEGIDVVVSTPWFYRPRSGAKGYLLSITEATEAYVRAGYKNIYIEQPTAELAGFINALPEGSIPKMKTYIRSLFKRMLGDPTEGETAIGMHLADFLKSTAVPLMKKFPLLSQRYQAEIENFSNLPPHALVRSLVAFGKEMAVLKHLSFNLRTPMNISLDTVNTFALDPEATAKAIAAVARGSDHATEAAFNLIGVRSLVRQRFEGSNVGPVVRKKLSKAALFLVDASDLWTKKVAFYAGRYRHLVQNPQDFEGANMLGIRFMEQTQPLFLVSTTPPWLASPTGRALLQWSSAPLKVTEFLTTRMTKEKVGNYVLAAAVLSKTGEALGLPLYRQLLPAYIEDWDWRHPIDSAKLSKARLGFFARLGVSIFGELAAGAVETATTGRLATRRFIRGLGAAVPLPEAVLDIAQATLGPETQKLPIEKRLGIAAGFNIPVKPNKPTPIQVSRF